MPTQLFYPDVSNPLHIFPLDVCFPFEAEDNYFVLHVLYVTCNSKNFFIPSNHASASFGLFKYPSKVSGLDLLNSFGKYPLSFLL